jgi:hypothetical protein
MSSLEQNIREIKKILEKQHGREFTWEEAAETQSGLATLAEICFELWQEDERRKDKLLKFPKGFAIDDTSHMCIICKNITSKSWFDKYGLKCSICQGAVDRKEIPAHLAKDGDCWYSRDEMRERFNLKNVTINAWIKKGILKARTVTRDSKRIHLQLFLIRENKGTLPPKKLTEPHMIHEERDGQIYFHSEPWYRFVDPYKHLKGYKIMDYLRVVPLE